MFPTFSVLPYECVAKGWDHGMRLGTPLFLNSFSCPQPPREVGTGLGPPGEVGTGDPAAGLGAGKSEPGGFRVDFGHERKAKSGRRTHFRLLLYLGARRGSYLNALWPQG